MENNTEDNPETNPETKLVPTTVHVPSKADRRLYHKIDKELDADTAIVGQALLRISRNLKIMNDRRLYFCGGFNTFEEWCRNKWGKTRQAAYHLIHAYDLLQNLLEAGVAEEDLPPTEKLCRAIRTLPLEIQAKVWKTIQRAAKAQGRRPTISDVEREAAREAGEPLATGEPTPSQLDRQGTELVHKLRGIRRSLSISLDSRILTLAFRATILGELAGIQDAVNQLMVTLKHHGDAEDNEVQEDLDGEQAEENE
jgi:hypothetical protein